MEFGKVWKIANISNSFLFEDWNISEYFIMLKRRLLHFREIFLREYGDAGDWYFWGLIFFLIVIFIIYVRLFSETFKRAENIIEEENDDTDTDEPFEEELPDNNIQQINQTTETPLYEETNQQYNADNMSANIVEEDAPSAKEYVQTNIQQNYEQGEETQTDDDVKEKEEMDKKISADIVQASKISDDYLNLKNVLYKQSKDNMENSGNSKTSTQIKTQDKIWDLDQTVGIIINMLAHMVSDKKIAQSIHFLNKGADDDEEIIQLIKAIKNFIGYYNTGKFAQLPNIKNLPVCADALFALAAGNTKPCMELMEALLNAQVVLAQRQKGLSKELSYALAAEYACTMGTIANLDNYELAINSFELALDLAPKNVNALSRVADLYWQDNNQAKAADVYQQVLSLADDVIYPEQKANANLKLAQYYRVSGKMFKADEMEKEGRKFFENYGIKNPLSEAEKKTLQILLDEQDEKLSEYIEKLL